MTWHPVYFKSKCRLKRPNAFFCDDFKLQYYMIMFNLRHESLSNWIRIAFKL